MSVGTIGHGVCNQTEQGWFAWMVGSVWMPDDNGRLQKIWTSVKLVAIYARSKAGTERKKDKQTTRFSMGCMGAL